MSRRVVSSITGGGSSPRCGFFRGFFCQTFFLNFFHFYTILVRVSFRAWVKIVFETSGGQQIGHNLNETQRNCETL